MYKVSIVAAVFFSLAQGQAQTTWASISGRVNDATGGGIAAAKVRALRSGSVVREATADTAGSYSLPFLPAGSYTVEASAAGFRPVQVSMVEVQAGATVQLPLVLEVGAMAGNVSVSGTVDPLQTESASRSEQIDFAQLRSLPVLGRQIYNLISLSPGVLFTQEQFGSNGYTGLRDWSSNGKYIINGGVEGTNQFLLNNAPVSLTGRWQISPSVEAIQEVRVLTNTYDAEYGRTGGGTVLTTLRSGGNSWHGEGYEFLHFGFLDANSFDNNAVGIDRGTHISNQFGGTIGGPVRKNKDFVFLSADSYYEISPSPLVSDTPPLDLRDGQHFANYGIQIYDPLTRRPCNAAAMTCLGSTYRLPFPGDVIPASRISPIGQKILSLYPAPNLDGLTQNYDASGNQSHYKYLQPIGRWDHNLNDRNRLYALTVIELGNQRQSLNGFPAPADIGDGNAERTSQHYVAEWTNVLSPRSVFSLRASYGRLTEFFPSNACPNCLTAQSLGISIPNSMNGASGGAPTIDLGFFNSIIGNTYTWNTENQIDLAPSLTMTRGNHVMHVGLEWAYSGIGSGGPGAANGELQFSRDWTQEFPYQLRNSGDGSAVADLLLGAPNTGFVDYNSSYYRRWPYYAGYFQDTWKVRRNLTIGLGLRYDVQIPFTELHNRVNAGFDFTTVNAQYSSRIIANWKALQASWNAQHPNAAIPYPNPPKAIVGGPIFVTGNNPRPFKTDWTDFQPRVGLAWTFAPKTVFRAGAGIFYRTATDMSSSYGFNRRTYYSRSLNNLTPSAGLTGPYSLQDPFPDGISAPAGTSAGLSANIGSAVTFDNPYRPIPRTYEYSAGFQRELPFQMLADVSYSGSITVHDALAATLNADAYTRSADTADAVALQTATVPNPFYNIVSHSTELGNPTDIPVAWLTRPYPQFTGVGVMNFPAARYRYDSLQAKLEKRVFDIAPAGIFSFIAAYTFSKTFSADHRLNPWNLSEAPVHELASTDRPTTLAFAGTWDLPLGWGRRYFSTANSFAAALINSWAVDWIYTFASGTPVSVPDAVFTCGSYAAPGGQRNGMWFNNNPSCYQVRNPYALRTGADVFSNIRTPSAPQLNVSAEKTIWLNEKYFLQIRAEAFNVTNTPIFPGPSTDPADPRFGQLPLHQSNFPRFVQVAAKIVF